jgi:segregation and condensation protein A
MFGNFLYFAKDKKGVPVIFSPTYEITLPTLSNAMSEVLQGLTKITPPIPKVTVGKIMSLEEMIDKLSSRIQKSLKTSFRDFSNIGKTEKVHVIVSFLAMLELVKKGIVRVNQEKHFDDISIESDNIEVPRY